MSDERSPAPGGTIDQAIDRVVRDLLTGEAPADLRARVLARIEEPAATWWSPRRIVTAAAALSVVAIAAYLAWPSRTAPVVRPQAEIAEARPPAATPTPPEAVTTPAAASNPTDAAPARPSARVVTAAAVVEPAPYEFRSPRDVPGLDYPELIEIHPMPPDTIDVDPVTVEPLAFERLAIEPLGGSR